MNQSKTYISNNDLIKDERKQNEIISNNYSFIYSKIAELENELKNTSEKDVMKVGYIKAQIALLNKKKKLFENRYFNY